MTTPSTQRKAGPLLGTGVQTTWPFTFKVFAETDIAVTTADSNGIETTLTYAVDYSVSLNANQETSPGGTVTYPISGTPLPAGSRLVIFGNLPYDQPLDLPSGGNFSPLALENQLDRATMQIQQLDERMDRAIVLPVSVAGTVDPVLPSPQSQTVIGWDVNGTGLQNYDLPALFSGAVYADWIAQTFTGNGTQTVFILQRAPGAIGNCDVSIAGVTQVPNVDYTLSGNVLAFTSAPTNGLTILVRYGSAASQVASTFSTESQTATAAQTVFTLASVIYNPGTNSMAVYVNGLRVVSGVDYLETDINEVTFTSGLSLGDEVLFIAGRTINETVGAEAVSYQPAGTSAVSRTVQSKLRETVSVKDFGAVGDGVADDTAAIQAALNASNDVFLPSGTYNFTTLIVRQNTRLQGASTRKSILKHTGSGAAITCTHSGSTEPDGNSAYIESGWFIFEDFTLLANGTFGFRVGNTRSSFSQWNRIYMRHRQDGGTYTVGSVAIDADNTPWGASDAAYLSKIHHTFIRGFETAVNLQDVVNAWEINRLYTISCLKQIVLSNATGISVIDNYFESGIAGAIGITFLSGGGNQINVVGTTFELTNAAATQYAYSFVGGTWSDITVIGAKYLIQGDGNAVNSRRVNGTAPLSFVELGRTYTNTTLSQNLPMLWAPGVASNKPFQQPNYSRFGGVPGGNGRVILARAGNDANDGWIENDGGYGFDFVAPGSGSVVDFNWKGSDGTVHLKYQGYTDPQFSPGSDNSIALGTASKRWTTTHSINIKLTPVTVANLPAAGTIGAGARAFVSDANSTTFASIVAGGGANNVPVYSDGTNWRIG